MDYTGLLWKYRLQRSITDREKRDRLTPKERIDTTPLARNSLVYKNDTYLEIVDKFYASKGFELFALTFGIALAGSMIAMVFYFLLVDKNTTNTSGSVLVDGAVILVFLGLLIVCLYFATKLSFSYTHWPVRFNRKNRCVYVFRQNGPNGVLQVPWDEVFFTLGYGKAKFLGSYPCYLCGHVLDENGEVKDTFAFGYVSTDREIQTRVLPHWEYIRRFMENGPNAVPEPDGYLPIAENRETIAYSFFKSFQQYAYNWITLTLFSPLAVMGGIGRVLAMKTSKIPRWPDEVKDACGD